MHGAVRLVGQKSHASLEGANTHFQPLPGEGLKPWEDQAGSFTGAEWCTGNPGFCGGTAGRRVVLRVCIEVFTKKRLEHKKRKRPSAQGEGRSFSSPECEDHVEDDRVIMRIILMLVGNPFCGGAVDFHVSAEEDISDPDARS